MKSPATNVVVSTARRDSRTSPTVMIAVPTIGNTR